jgi:nitrite reductase (NADH) large subunit
VAAGFETGQAYGKSVRTVKSCVGSTWCRYGVQDSMTLTQTRSTATRGCGRHTS